MLGCLSVSLESHWKEYPHSFDGNHCIFFLNSIFDSKVIENVEVGLLNLIEPNFWVCRPDLMP